MWNTLNDYEVRHLLYHLALAQKFEHLLKLIVQCAYLEEFVSRNDYRQLLDSVSSVIPLCVSHPRASEISALIGKILSNEAGSLDGWKKDDSNFSFYNQLANAAVYSGVDLTFVKPDINKSLDLNIKWKNVTHDADYLRIIKFGDRRGFAWDIYDAGWMGSSHEYWIDPAADQILVQTLSTYCYSSGYYGEFYLWKEYSLTFGTLLKEYAEVECKEFGDYQKFAPLSFKNAVESAKRISISETLKATIIQEIKEKRYFSNPHTDIAITDKSLNSDDFLFTADLEETTGNAKRSKLSYVFNLLTKEIHNTDITAKIGYLVKIGDTLYGFKMINDDIIRFAIHLSKEPSATDNDLLAAEIDPYNEFLILVKSSGIEIRRPLNNQLVRSLPHNYGGTRDVRIAINARARSFAISFPREYVAKKPETNVMIFSYPEFKPSNAVIDQSSMYLILIPTLDRYIVSNQVFDLFTNGSLLKFADADKPVIGVRYQFSSAYGTYYLSKDESQIKVWMTDAANCFRTLGMNWSPWGGTDYISAFAVSHDERFVIGSRMGKSILVWHLDKYSAAADINETLPSWQMNTGELLSNIKTLAFINGGYWVVVLTEDQRLAICTFESETKILLTVRLPQMPRHLLAPAYARTVLAVMEDGSMICYEVTDKPVLAQTTVIENSATFRFVDTAATTVELAGSFHSWSRTPMERTNTGIWQSTIQLPPGRHVYKFLVDGTNWQSDPSTNSVPGDLDFNSYIDV